MTGPDPGARPDLDILIVGAGISGIAMAAYLGKLCTDHSYAIFERRRAIGGTWDLFRYPGVRSDSDMHTLGYSFAPWPHEEAIADGAAIRTYLETTAHERGITPQIRFGREVLAADWDSALALWRVTARDVDGVESVTTARWLYFASGYYDYDQPHDAQLPGLERFGGTVAHPQFWPTGLDHAGKRVVVIGSGATAVTIVPAMAEAAQHVTMLQRTPTWMAARPRRDAWDRWLRRWLPKHWAAWLIRQKNITLGDWFFRLSRRKPHKAAAMLRRMLHAQMGDAYAAEHFEPPYDPWQQRLCLVPDGDLFQAIRRGTASIVTGQIAGFDANGVILQSGERVPADIVVAATGLRLVLAGKAAITMDGKPIDFAQHFFYRGAMFSNLPNLAVVFGYLNASWTLRAENNAAFVARILAHMRATGTSVAVPALTPGEEPAAVEPFDYTSGYLQRARAQMPKSAAELPWRLNHDYRADARDFRTRPVADGVLRFTNPPQRTAAGANA